MADSPKYHIILLPRQDYWQWVDAVRDYAVHFNITVTPSPQNALDFHHPDQVITIVNGAAGYPQYGDISAWLAQRSPNVRQDVLNVATPAELVTILGGRQRAGVQVDQAVPAAAPKPVQQAAFELAWPTDYPTVLQAFGANPELYRRWGLPGHDGIDIKAPVNSNIYACADGAVARVHDGSGGHPYGIHVRIVHPQGFQTVYGHLNQAMVSSGQVVKAGDVIGLADGTGISSGGVLHLTLKQEGATAAGLTRYPSDIVDPTPYLKPGRAQPRVEVIDPTWLYDHCLAGLAARPDGGMAQADWDVVRAARIEAIKISASTPPAVIQQALGINPIMFVMANLSLNFGGRIISPAEFVRRVENEAKAFSDLGVDYFEIHSEPNLVAEGFGSSWRDGYEFGQWFLQVVGQLRPKLPQARFGWPGLSLGPRVDGMRSDALLFLEEAGTVISQADWIGCHCFWQDDGGMMALDGGLGYKLLRDEWPSTPLMITEFSNTSPDVPAEEKGRQYARYFQLLHDQPGIVAAFASVVSAHSGYRYEVWRSEAGEVSPIVREVASRAG